MKAGGRRAGITIAAAALIGAGCGGEEQQTTTPATEATPTIAEPTSDPRDGKISGEEFIRRADQVCDQHEEQMVEAFGALQNPGSDLPSFATVLAAAAAAVGALSAELDAVPLPEDSGDAATYIENLRRSAAVIERGSAAAAASDQAGVEAAVGEFGELADETGRLGSKLGFKRCGKAAA